MARQKSRVPFDSLCSCSFPACQGFKAPDASPPHVPLTICSSPDLCTQFLLCVFCLLPLVPCACAVPLAPPPPLHPPGHASSGLREGPPSTHYDRVFDNEINVAIFNAKVRWWHDNSVTRQGKSVKSRLE